jgi:hypothetical protein
VIRETGCDTIKESAKMLRSTVLTGDSKRPEMTSDMA